MNALPDNQKKIMDFLLNHPEGATLDELVPVLGITKTAVKEHMAKLQGYGYVTFSDERVGVGRPRRRYLLSPQGQEVFPRQYSWLSNVLLEVLAENMGADSVSRFMRDLAKKVAGSMESRFKNLTSTKEILKEVTKALNELGYRSSLKQSDVRKGAVIEATNCVYHTVAKEHPILCQFDVQFLKNCSGMDVRLEKCIARGDSVCRFCLKGKEESV